MKYVDYRFLSGVFETLEDCFRGHFLSGSNILVRQNFKLTKQELTRLSKRKSKLPTVSTFYIFLKCSGYLIVHSHSLTKTKMISRPTVSQHIRLCSKSKGWMPPAPLHTPLLAIYGVWNTDNGRHRRKQRHWKEGNCMETTSLYSLSFPTDPMLTMRTDSGVVIIGPCGRP